MAQIGNYGVTRVSSEKVHRAKAFSMIQEVAMLGKRYAQWFICN